MHPSILLHFYTFITTIILLNFQDYLNILIAQINLYDRPTFFKWKLLQAHHALKIIGVNVAEQTWNAFSKQVSSNLQQSVVEITERLFKKAVPIHFVNYFTTNNILWT